MLCNLWVLVGSAIHNVHNTIKGCNTGTSWISADRDRKLGKFCVCGIVCMHSNSGDPSAKVFANFNFRAIIIFRDYSKIRHTHPTRKKGLYSNHELWQLKLLYVIVLSALVQ